MTRLITAPNIIRPDHVYQSLIDLHRDLGTEESMRINTKLILLLVNHIGDEEVIREAIAIARDDPVTSQNLPVAGTPKGNPT